MQQGITLSTTIEALKERAAHLDEAIGNFGGRLRGRRLKAFNVLRAERDAVLGEIERRRLLQTTLENL